MTAALSAAVFALTLLSISAIAEDLKHGEALLNRHCGACHAVGRTGESAQKDAPALRVLGQRYPVESLEEALGEGFMHKTEGWLLFLVSMIVLGSISWVGSHVERLVASGQVRHA